MLGTIVSRAPGRVNLIGEHTDYNGGLCLPFAIDLATTATVTPRADDEVHVSSSEPGGRRYVEGVVGVLRSLGWDVPGLDVTIDSDVPVGAGLSSSAALECSVAVAIAGLLDHPLDDAGRRMLAEACRRAETEHVGAPTGGMDQLASLMCREGHALLIDFSAGSQRHVPLRLGEAGMALLVVDTGVAHDLAAAESGYAARRAECEARHPARLRHVESENQRVEDAVVFLNAQDWEQLGRVLTASHLSLRDDFEVSTPELDAVVHSAVEAGALGARMTGGGFGGSAIALVPEARVDATRRAVTTAFAAEGWPPPSYYPVTPARAAEVVSG